MQRKTWGIKAYIISALAIALVFIAIPYFFFKSHPIWTTLHIWIGIMAFLTFLRSRDYWFFTPNSTFDQVVTILIWVFIALPVFPVLGLLSMAIIICIPPSIYIVMRILCITVTFIFGIRIKVFGRPPREQAIYIANHCADIDDAFNSLFIYRAFKVLFAPEVRRLPFAQFFLKRIGIPIKRADKKSRFISFLKVYRAFQKGFSMLIYAEGGRLRSDDMEHYKKVKDGYRTSVFGPENLSEEIQFLLPFEDGAFDLSMKTGKKIHMVVMSWTYLFKPRSGQWWFSPRTIEVHHLGLVSAEPGDNLESFKNRVWNIMEKKLRELYITNKEINMTWGA